MGDDVKFSNQRLGKNGWLYWVLMPCFLGPAHYISVLLPPVLNRDYSNEGRLTCLGLLLYLVILVAQAAIVYVLAVRTAKQIELLSGEIHITTFSGKRICFGASQTWSLHKRSFTRQHHYALFPKDRESLVIQGERYACSISAYTDDFETLSKQLYQLRRDTAFAANISRTQVC
jgi:hypothetical protein